MGADKSECDPPLLSQVDSVLLSHPFVAEAVSFGAPDEKYGEVVAAAVVLTGNAPKDHKQVRAFLSPNP